MTTGGKVFLPNGETITVLAGQQVTFARQICHHHPKTEHKMAPLSVARSRSFANPSKIDVHLLPWLEK